MAMMMDRRGGMPQQEFRAIRGAGLVIAHVETEEILTKIERKRRVTTGREANEVSLPFETQKQGESEWDNVVGAFPEVFNDATFPHRQLVTVTSDRLPIMPRRLFFDGQRVIDYSLAVVLFTGPQGTHFEPHDIEESIPRGWDHPAAVLVRPDLRELARHAVGWVHEQGIIPATIAAYHDPTSQVEHVVSPRYVVSEAYREREQLPDVEPYPMWEGELYSLV